MEFFGTLAGPFFQKLLFILLGLFCAAYVAYRLQNHLRAGRVLTLAAVIDAPEDMYRVFKTVMKQKIRFQVRLNGRRRSYDSSLIEVRHDRLYIDALFPEEGQALIASSRFIEVDFMLREAIGDFRHIPYAFRSAYLESVSIRGYPGVRIAFPERIRRHQRREYLRISPPVQQPLHVRLTVDGAEVQEKVANISGGGLGFYTRLGREVLWPGRQIQSAGIDLPNGARISCAVTVRKHALNDRTIMADRKPCPYYCGIEFTGADEQVRETVVRYVIERERDELRRLSREYA
jgi:c-di-GMP-binding flagellar brake protein YcgR